MFRKVLELSTSTSLFLSLNSALVVVFGFSIYGHPIAPEIVLAAFLVTFSVYGLNKVTDKVEDSVNRPATASRSSRYYLISSIVAMLICLSIGALDGLKVFLVLLAPFIIGLIYSVRLVKTLPRLKEIVGVKSFVVALSWAITGALLPDAFQYATFEKLIFVFTYIFVQLLVNTIIFDYLDMRGDKVSGVTTIPMVLGKRRTRIFLTGINTLLAFLIIYCILRSIFIQFVPVFLFGFLYDYFIIWIFTSGDHRRFHAELFVDGEWLPIVGLIKAILH